MFLLTEGIKFGKNGKNPMFNKFLLFPKHILCMYPTFLVADQAHALSRVCFKLQSEHDI